MRPTNAKKNSPVAQNSTSCVDVISFGVFSFSNFSLCDFMLNFCYVIVPLTGPRDVNLQPGKQLIRIQMNQY